MSVFCLSLQAEGQGDGIAGLFQKAGVVDAVAVSVGDIVQGDGIGHKTAETFLGL